MSSSLQLLHTINRIAEELSSEECKRLSYLCGKRCTANVKEMLQSCVAQVHEDQTFLMELMLSLRRYDLLSEVLGISKTEAEQLLKDGHALSDYRVFMAELSEDVGSDDLELLVFLLRGTLPKEKVEKFECFLDVVVELEKLDLISSTRTDIMEKYLRTIHRADLAKRLSQYQSRAEKRSPSTVKPNDERQPRRASSSCSSAYTPVTFRPSRHQSNTPAALSSASVTIPTIGTEELLCVSTSKQCEWQEEVYWMGSEPRGVCVITDCVGNEGAHLEQLFSRLHFRVIHHKLLGAREIQSHLQQVARQTEHCGMDAFVCCIISRSRSSQLLGTDSHRPGLDLNAVRQMFTPDSCPGLTGKPKLFFIQSYETAADPPEYGELETDGPTACRCGVEDVPGDADFFWSHCWTNEKRLEDIGHQSVYLGSLQKALVDGQARRIHLVDLHMAVNRAVYAHTHSHPQSAYHINLRHTLRKNIYFS